MAARLATSEAPSSSELLTFVEQCAAANASNFSSMHQDVLHGRRTEIEQLNGWVAARSRDLGLGPARANERLAQAVRDAGVESYSQARSEVG